MKNRLIAITGGIGAGKSVVSGILRAMGYEVYDCDSRAKKIMDESRLIKQSIADGICREAITASWEIDRGKLSEAVFADANKLECLNALVHEAVRNDIRQWRRGRNIAFVETAILYQSGLDAMVDAVWKVEAPAALRIERVMKRSRLSRKQVECRINAQNRFVARRCHQQVERILNDGDSPLLPRVESLLASLLFCQWKEL